MRRSCSVVSVVLVICVVFGFSAEGHALQLFGIEEEIRIGRDIADQLEKKHGLYHDRDWLAKIEKMGRALAAQSQRPNLPYNFRILNDDEVNALAAPGGFVYINRGLLDIIESDDELAAVLAHEVAHVANRHGMNQLERNVGISLGISFVLHWLLRGDDRLATWQQLSNLGLNLLMKGYSRENEFDADQTGVTLMVSAGYDPNGMIDLLTKFQAMEGEGVSGLETLFRTHPPTKDRIEQVEQFLQQGDLPAAS